MLQAGRERVFTVRRSTTLFVRRHQSLVEQVPEPENLQALRPHNTADLSIKNTRRMSFLKSVRKPYAFQRLAEQAPERQFSQQGGPLHPYQGLIKNLPGSISRKPKGSPTPSPVIGWLKLGGNASFSREVDQFL